VKLWRISNYADLSGAGGLKAAGRWHNRGIPIIYAGESIALSMLETLVHFELAPDEVPDSFQLIAIKVAENIAIAQLSQDALLNDWQRNQDYTRAIGDEWLMSGSSVLLKVPSAIIPESYNYLFNPRHPDADKIQIDSVRHCPFDQRLIN
jgi:RES domain-containing protein